MDHDPAGLETQVVIIDSVCQTDTLYVFSLVVSVLWYSMTRLRSPPLERRCVGWGSFACSLMKQKTLKIIQTVIS